MTARLLILVCLSLPLLAAPSPELAAELARLDARATYPDGKLVVAAVLAEHLGVHRNHLVFQRKQTGRTYGQILVSMLESAGVSEAEILRRVRRVNADIERELAEAPARLSPLLLVSSALDYNSAGAFYSVTPEAGVDLGRVTLLVGLPLYRNAAVQPAAHGVGDAYAAAYLREARGPVDLGASFTAGFPTGDRSRGLGAGKATVDGVGSLGFRFSNARFYVNAGLTNSVFNNVGYQRPYITGGPAAHFSGGLEGRWTSRVTLGLGGFAVRPLGEQEVMSRVVTTQAVSADAETPGLPPRIPILSPELRPGRDGPLRERLRDLRILETVQWIVAPGEDLQDHGPNAWISFLLGAGVSLDLAAARSAPFRLTTVRVGLSFDLGYWVSQSR
jgi:hypothetical protein